MTKGPDGNAGEERQGAGGDTGELGPTTDLFLVYDKGDKGDHA